MHVVGVGISSQVMTRLARSTTRSSVCSQRVEPLALCLARCSFLPLHAGAAIGPHPQPGRDLHAMTIESQAAAAKLTMQQE